MALLYRLRYLSIVYLWKFVSILRRLFKNGRYSFGSWKEENVNSDENFFSYADRINFLLTFCDFSATIRTNSKSYIPSATSYIWLTSTRKRTYLRASSDVTHSVSVVFTGLAEMKAKRSLELHLSDKQTRKWILTLFNLRQFDFLQSSGGHSRFAELKCVKIHLRKKGKYEHVKIKN